jgi:hypothetical protein
MLCLMPWTYFRYLLGLLPVAALLLGGGAWMVWRRSRLLAVAFMAALLGTNLFSVPLSTANLRFDLVAFAKELTDDYKGPNEAIVSHLREHGQRDHLVLTNYGELPIAFYTGMRVYGFSRDPRNLVESPDWIIPRRGRPFEEYLHWRARGYSRTVLDGPDIPWDNRPDPYYHRYVTVSDAPPVIIYRRQQ